MTREEWLKEASALLAPRFEAAGKPLPHTIRVSCGFPSHGARGKVIGQCWQPEASADRHHEVFISPLLDDPASVLGTLAHELAHAALPKGTKHNKTFATLAYAIGLEGKPTNTVPSAAFKRDVVPVVLSAIGPYPHAKLTPGTEQKKQSTRLLKVECDDCGYTARVTRKWVDDAGTPLCPCNSEHMRLEQ